MNLPTVKTTTIDTYFYINGVCYFPAGCIIISRCQVKETFRLLNPLILKLDEVILPGGRLPGEDMISSLAQKTTAKTVKGCSRQNKHSADWQLPFQKIACGAGQQIRIRSVPAPSPFVSNPSEYKVVCAFANPYINSASATNSSLLLYMCVQFCFFRNKISSASSSTNRTNK